MWVKHDGKGMPVSPDTKVIVRFRDGVESQDVCNADLYDWSHCDDGRDIVAYRVIE